MQEEVTRGAVTLIVDGAKLSEQVFEKTEAQNLPRQAEP